MPVFLILKWQYVTKIIGSRSLKGRNKNTVHCKEEKPTKKKRVYYFQVLIIYMLYF